jgi:hypothetical protein
MRDHAAFLLAASLALTGVYGADYYKWVDEEGRTHYGDRPPLHAPFEPVAPPPRPSDAERERAEERVHTQQRRLDELMEQRGQQQAAERAAEEARARERQEKCAAAQRELNWLRQTIGARIAVPAEDGSPRWLSDSYRLARMQELRREVAKWCR